MYKNLTEQLEQYNPVFRGIETVEDGFCLATLIAVKELPYDARAKDAQEYFENINQDCARCKYNQVCLASIMNE